MKNKYLIFIGFFLIHFSCEKRGCTDENALNYNPNANYKEGCIYDLTSPSLFLSGTIENPMKIDEQVVKINSRIFINSDLILSPGCTIIMGAQSEITIQENGSIQCLGTEEKPIIIKGEIEQKGYWKGIRILEYNKTNKNKFIYTTIKDGGAYVDNNKNCNLFIGRDASVIIQNSSFENSLESGLYLNAFVKLPSFKNNTFSNNEEYPIISSPDAIKFLDSETDYNFNNSNGKPYINLYGFKFNEGENQIWSENINVPILISNSLELDIGLTILAGNTILIRSALRVNGNGFIKAIGSENDSIIFDNDPTSSTDKWNGIYINNTQTPEQNNQLKYVKISNAGKSASNQMSSILIEDDSQLIIDNSTIENSTNWAIFVKEFGTIISNNTQQFNSGGLEINNNFINNGTGPFGSFTPCTGNCSVYFQ